MTETTEPPTLRTTQPAKKRGCFFYGCLTSIVLLVVMALVAFFAVRYVKNLVRSYTDTSPMELPRVEVTDAEYEALQQRLTSFKAGLEKGESAQTLTLSEQDINALVARSQDLKQLRDKVYVSVEGDQIKGQVSWPLDETGFRWLKGRYLNGAVTFNVSLEDGELKVIADSVEVMGKKLPEQAMTELRKENLAAEAANDPDVAESISKFDSIKIEDGKVVVKSRDPDAGAAGEQQ